MGNFPKDIFSLLPQHTFPMGIQVVTDYGKRPFSCDSAFTGGTVSLVFISSNASRTCSSKTNWFTNSFLSLLFNDAAILENSGAKSLKSLHRSRKPITRTNSSGIAVSSLSSLLFLLLEVSPGQSHFRGDQSTWRKATFFRFEWNPRILQLP